MTEGGNQGLFVIVAVVIFGIFVLISYLLFGDKMKTGLATIYCDAFTITSKNTGFKTAQGCQIDLGNDDNVSKEYFKIRDKDDAKGWSEVWVLAEFDSNNNATIIDSGNKDKFNEGDLGTSLIGDISFPDTLSNGASIQNLGKHAFEQAKFANVMKLPKDLIILDDYTLKQSNFSGEAEFPENLEIIGIEALRDSRFSGRMPELPNIKEIKDNAFENSEFEGVMPTFPKINFIGEKAFANSKFTGEFKNIGSNATGIDNSTGNIGSGNNGGIGGIGNENPIDTSSHGISGEGGVMISANAFQNSEFTGTYKVPKNVSIIGDNAFQNSKFTKLDLSGNNNLVVIGDNVFENSEFTGNLLLPNSIRYIGDKAFYKSKFSNKDLILPMKLETVGKYAFYNSKFSGKLGMNKNLRVIDDYAFYNSLTDVKSETTPRSGDFKLSGMVYTGSTITLSENLERIGNYAFYKARINQDFDMRQSPKLKYIGDYAFYNSFSSGWVYTGIANDKVRYRREFKDIYFNNAIEYIGKNSFMYSQFNGYMLGKNKQHVLPDSLKELGDSAFYNSFYITDESNTVALNNLWRGYMSISKDTNIGTDALRKSSSQSNNLIVR